MLQFGQHLRPEFGTFVLCYPDAQQLLDPVVVDGKGEKGAFLDDLLVFVNLDRYGNTSAASVAIALDEAVNSGRIHRGDLILLVVFGAGLTWGAAVIEW